MTYEFVSEYYLAWTEGMTDSEIAGTTKADLIEWLTGENSTIGEDVDVEYLADRILDRIREDWT